MIKKEKGKGKHETRRDETTPGKLLKSSTGT